MTHGQFEDDVVAKWLKNLGADRDMELAADFTYVDPEEERWEAPRGSVINGASIPNGLWSIVGCPFVGDYRRAAVLHDVYYGDHQGKTRRQVDEMFRFAMLADGVSEHRANLMYAGVRIGGGGAWDAAALIPKALPPPGAPPPPDWVEFETWFEAEAAGLDKEELDAALEERYGPIPD